MIIFQVKSNILKRRGHMPPLCLYKLMKLTLEAAIGEKK